MNSKFRQANINGLVHDLERKNAQEAMSRRQGRNLAGQNKSFENMNINSSLARAFNDFLNGKTNGLPNINLFADIYRKSKYNVVSMGYGIIINKEFKLTYESPCEDDKYEREDIFTPDWYKAVIYLKTDVKNVDVIKTYKQIDANKEPLFEKGRINFTVNYLRKCRDRIQQLGEDEEMSLK